MTSWRSAVFPRDTGMGEVPWNGAPAHRDAPHQPPDGDQPYDGALLCAGWQREAHAR